MLAEKQKNKRSGHHHRHTKKYVKVYWPYAPIALIVAVGLFLGNWEPQTKNGVLAYATEMSITTLLDASNQQRGKNDKPALKLNGQLTKAAQDKANDMTTRNYWSHNTPEGKEPWIFVQGAGYNYQKAGENLAYGFNSSSETVAGWMNSPRHKENLLDPNYSEVGFGFANVKDYNNSGPETVVVAMYGQPAGAALADETNAPNSQAFNSASAIQNEPSQLSIARIQTLTNGSAPWITFAVGLIGGLSVAYVVLKHGLAVKKLVIEGEEFFIHHPALDVLLVAVVMTGYVLLQGSGVIR